MLKETNNDVLLRVSIQVENYSTN